MDLVAGFIALIGLVLGRAISVGITSAINFSYFGIILGVIGLIVAGFGSKRRGFGGAFIIGIGLGIAIPLTLLIFR